MRLIGHAGAERLSRAHVAVFGLGGVGSFAAEALGRSGIGRLSLVDHDTVSVSNRNRQLPALCSTEGMYKTEVAGARLRDVNPGLELHLYSFRMTGENLDAILSGPGGKPDFIADAIDDIQGKISLILAAKKRGIPIVSSMGAGYRLDPAKLALGDVSETHTCPLARKLRRGLREAGIDSGVAVVWSKEPPIAALGGWDAAGSGVNAIEPNADAMESAVGAAKPVEPSGPPGPASMVFVPAAAGLLMASHIVRELLNQA